MEDKHEFRRYLKTLFIDNIHIVSLLCVLSAVITGLYSSIIRSYYLTAGATGELLDKVTDPRLAIIAYIGICSSAFSAIFAFFRFKRRRNLDMFLSIPLSRGAIGTAHYLLGLFTAFAPLLASIAVNFTALTIKADLATVDFGWYGIYLVGTAIFTLSFYTMYAFVFNEANTVFDGCAFMFLWHNVFYWIMYTRAKNSSNARLLSPTKYAERLSGYIEKKVGGKADYLDYLADFYTDPKIIAATLGWVFLGVLAGVLFTIRFRKIRYERVGEVSDSFFGYNMLIPLYALSGAVFGIDTRYDSLGHPYEITFCIIAAYVLYIVFRRGIKLKSTDYCVLGAIALLLVTSILKYFIP